ncbi:MAG TPA: UGSC family (seleno)protein, partial [Geobacteraceae bacterium]|nr:UGSC family (seleno)protein [Geobacteraceae bacterium]
MKSLILWVIMLFTLLFVPQLAIAKEIPQEWELIKPEGVVEVRHFDLAPRLTTLEGKTIVLRWNDKHNGNI